MLDQETFFTLSRPGLKRLKKIKILELFLVLHFFFYKYVTKYAIDKNYTFDQCLDLVRFKGSGRIRVFFLERDLDPDPWEIQWISSSDIFLC